MWELFSYLASGRDGSGRNRWSWASTGAGDGPMECKEGDRAKDNLRPYRWVRMEPSVASHLLTLLPWKYWGRTPLGDVFELTSLSQVSPALQREPVHSLFLHGCFPTVCETGCRHNWGDNRSDHEIKWPQRNVHLVSKNQAAFVRWVYHWGKHVSFHI